MSERKILIILILIFAAFVFVILGSAARGEDLYVLCKPGSVVNVRSGPGKDSAVLAWVECGQLVETDRMENGFAHVVGLASEEPEGWIYAGYLVDDEPRIETYTAEVWEGPVISRKSVNGRQKCVLADGKTVTVYARTHVWAITSRGYVMCDWLREVD